MLSIKMKSLYLSTMNNNDFVVLSFADLCWEVYICRPNSRDVA